MDNGRRQQEHNKQKEKMRKQEAHSMRTLQIKFNQKNGEKNLQRK